MASGGLPSSGPCAGDSFPECRLRKWPSCRGSRTALGSGCLEQFITVFPYSCLFILKCHIYGFGRAEDGIWFRESICSVIDSGKHMSERKCHKTGASERWGPWENVS